MKDKTPASPLTGSTAISVGATGAPRPAGPDGPPSLAVSFRTWCRVACLSFGGPAGQIAVMHRILVDEKKWITEDRFLHALNYCMLLPGPEAQQLATYIGWLMHRTVGGLMAGILFVLPGFLAILGLSIVYACFQTTQFIEALFFGLKPAVMAIVLEAVLRIGKRVLKNRVMFVLAVLSFIAIFLFGIPFPILILAAGVMGLVGGRIWPKWFGVLKSHGREPAATGNQEGGSTPTSLTSPRPTLLRAVRVSLVCLSLWFGPLVLVWLGFGSQSVYFQEGLFFSKAAVVTFGGAYSVLAYVAQQAVENYGWLRPGEMLDGLGMAETTPGPLIMVLQFVGFLGAFRDPGPIDPLIGGILASAITTWVTFVPCFYWIFLGAPYLEKLRGLSLLNSALSSITAAVVGVVMNLAVWFSVHTLFAQVATQPRYGLRILVPDPATFNPAAGGVAILALFLTFYLKTGMLITLAASAGLGAVLYLARLT